MSQFTIAEWRRLRGMSQADIAEKCGVHVNTWIKWEKKPSIIKISNAQKIAEVLQVDIRDIIFLP